MISRYRSLVLVATALALTAPAAVNAVSPAHALSMASGRDGLLGEVSSIVDSQRFVLSDQLLVVTDQTTVFLGGIAGVSDLLEGDLVQVEGTWIDGSSYLASVVTLLQGGDTQVTIQGTVAWVDAPDGFVLGDGTGVAVDAATDWIGVGGLEDLTPGDIVEVTGVPDAWWSSLQASSVRLVGHGDPDTVAFQATVAEVRPDGFVTECGDLIFVDDDTELVGLTSLQDLVAGAIVGVEAVPLTQAGNYRALTVELLDGPYGTLDLVTQVASVLDASRFTTVEGYTVETDGHTVLGGLDAIADLVPGDVVGVVGDLQDAVTIRASEVVLLEHAGGGGGSGLVVGVMGTVMLLSPPDGFVLDEGTPITTTAQTEWRGGLTGWSDLQVGMFLGVTGEFLEDGTVSALAVELLGTPEQGPVRVTGTVVAVPRENELVLDDGSDILLTPRTVIDGDADTAADIVPAMTVDATCIPLDDGRFEALDLIVAAPVTPDDFAGLDGEEASEALVVLASGALASEVAGRYGATLEGRLPGRRVVLFRWTDPLPGTLIEALLDDPEILALEANYRFHDPESTRRRMPIADRSPTSERYVHQAAAGATALDRAHTTGIGEGTLVAVIDTGVDPFHPLLRHRIAPGGRDFVDADDEPWETRNGIDDDGDGDVDEAAGHGTFVAGLVLLAAPGTRIVPYRVLDDDGGGSTFAVCEAVIAAMDRGVDVINLSLVYRKRSKVLDRLLDEAIERGVVLVAGTGNDGEDELPFPARDHRVISVAAADASGAVAAFSNAAPGVSLAAPGESLYSALLDGGFGTWSGTSMAAPLVSGTAAVMRSVNHRLTPGEIHAALVQSAAPLAGNPRGVHGLLDAAAALALVPEGT